MDEEEAQHRKFPPSYIPTAEESPIVDEPSLPYDDPQYTRTKFGGLRPFFNPESLWPVCKCCMRPMTFVGQINMNDSQFPLLIRQRLAVGGGTGIFQLFWWWVLVHIWGVEWLTLRENSPDDGPFCNWSSGLQSRFRAFFVTPISKPKGPPSLINLIARLIAKEIVEEGFPDRSAIDKPGYVHPLLTDLPEHLQRVVQATVAKERAESQALKHREYCVESLKTIEDFLAFDPSAKIWGTRPRKLDCRVKDAHLGEDTGTNRRFLYFPMEQIFTGWGEFLMGTDRLGAGLVRHLPMNATVDRPDWYVENVCLFYSHPN